MPPPTRGTAGPARLRQLLATAVSATGVDLEDVTVSPAGKRQVVRVVVDRDGGVDLDDVAAVSRAVSGALDEADEADPTLLGGAYVLEVSSPGVDRPLTEARHWRRSTGRLVQAELATGEVVLGRVVGADTLEAVLDVDGTRRPLLLAEVTRAAVQVEFSRRPGAADEDLPDEDLPDEDLPDEDLPDDESDDTDDADDAGGEGDDA